MNNIVITIFTPTYNRAYIIENLYKSLCNQTLKNFEWLIVDDGSSDNTEYLIKSFIAEDKILIKYVRQENGGKHRAINRGVKLAQGEIFFIVDSDDYLPINAISIILKYYESIKGNSSFAGISGLRYYPSNERVGGAFSYDILDCNSVDFRLKYNIKGDVAEVFKTSILKQYPFPEVEGEKFCPEALVWNRIALNYKLRYFNENIYICDYLPDGLSVKIVKVRKESPTTSMLYYSELYNMDIPFKYKIKSIINFWRFSFYSKESILSKINKIGLLSLLLYPIGFVFYIKDNIKI